MKSFLKLIFLIGCYASASYANDLAGVPATEHEFMKTEAGKMRTAGLDAKPLYNKIREGIAKGVPAEAMRKAVTRERELYTEAARLVAPVSTGGNPTKNQIAQSVVIAVKRGAKSTDIESAVRQNKDNPVTLIGVIDLLGDFGRSGITGEKAVRAASDTAARKTISSAAPADNRMDANRAIMQREIQQNLPALKPPIETTPVPKEPHNPTGTQGGTIQDKHR
jgi:hypothetical protein